MPQQDASPPQKNPIDKLHKNMREYSLEMPSGKCPLKVNTVPIMPGYCRWQMANFHINLWSRYERQDIFINLVPQPTILEQPILAIIVISGDLS